MLGSKIQLNRTVGLKRDRLRSYQIVIDGHKVGKIRDGESLEFDVTPGNHEIRLKIDVGGSQTLNFDINDGEVFVFSCEPSGDASQAVSDLINSFGKEGRPIVSLRRVNTQSK